MSEEFLPRHVLTEIDSPIRESRLMGVGELAQLVTSSDLAMAAAAQLALRRLSDDDSRSVAAAAATVLGRTAVRLNPDRVDFGEVPAGTPHLVADVLVEGPPLAFATATVTAAGPGLRAALTGRHLRILWQPRSDWLDGSITVNGTAGWAEVRVTGRVAQSEPAFQAALEAQLQAEAGVGGGNAARVTVLPAPPARRRAGAAVVIAGLTTLALLGGAGVAMALTNGAERDPPPVAAPGTPVTTAPAPLSAAVGGPATAAPAPSALARVPLALRAASTSRPAAIATIRVGNEPEGVAVSPDGRTVYVANQSSRILSVMDAASRRVTAVTLRHTPRFVTTSRDGGLVFVSMYEKDMSGSGVAVVDATSRRVVRYLATGVQPFTLAVCPDDRLWVPIHSKGRVEIYATADQRPDGQVTVPPNPHAVAFSASQRRAFTANHESNAVSIIDMRTDKVLRSVPVSRSPHSVAVSPDGGTVLVAGYEANTADLIDAKTMRRTGPFRVGRQPQSVAFAGDGRHAYVVNEGDDTVSVLNGHTGAVTATVRVGRSPRTVAVSPDGRLAYVTNGGDDTISVLRVGE
ncbi:YncE family protein [Actinoplanes sp. NPDC049118]|uniref:YncE family protein n=1 Tax=Actinoplanes sp. NPDC049118 TaxID=3155769 RepID=UPI0033C6D8E1